MAGADRNHGRGWCRNHWCGDRGGFGVFTALALGEHLAVAIGEGLHPVVGASLPDGHLGRGDVDGLDVVAGRNRDGLGRDNRVAAHVR